MGAGGVVVGRDLVGDPGAGGHVADHLEHHAVIPQHVGGESAHGLAVAVDRAEAGRLDVEAVHLVEGGEHLRVIERGGVAEGRGACDERRERDQGEDVNGTHSGAPVTRLNPKLGRDMFISQYYY